MNTIQTTEDLTRAVSEMQPKIDELRNLQPAQRDARLQETFRQYISLLARLDGVADKELQGDLREKLLDQVCDLQTLTTVSRTPVLERGSPKEEIKRRIYEVVKKPGVVAFATVDEGGNPRTRYVVAAADENLNVVFATSPQSRKCADLRRNPNVHVCFKDHSTEADVEYVQIEGVARILDDQESKKACWNPFLWLYFRGPDDPDYVVVRVVPRRAELWSLVDLKRGAPPMVWDA